MRIAIGADHAGYTLKEHLKELLAGDGHDVHDLGTDSEAPVDYPPICAAVAREVAGGRADRGIVLGGSGQGEQIAANNLCNDLYTARYSRLHNDANVLSIGARVIGVALADEIVRTWFDTEFEGGRHVPRVEQITEIEEQECG
jgi:ribose 5-phosphate isomerase B